MPRARGAYGFRELLGRARSGVLLDNSLAEAESRYRVTSGCSRNTEAGHDTSMGPSSIARTAAALRGPGTWTLRRRAVRNTGTVRVSAWLGTSATERKQPSLTCCWRHAPS